MARSHGGWDLSNVQPNSAITYPIYSEHQACHFSKESFSTPRIFASWRYTMLHLLCTFLCCFCQLLTTRMQFFFAAAPCSKGTISQFGGWSVALSIAQHRWRATLCWQCKPHQTKVGNPCMVNYLQRLLEKSLEGVLPCNKITWGNMWPHMATCYQESNDLNATHRGSATAISSGFFVSLGAKIKCLEEAVSSATNSADSNEEEISQNTSKPSPRTPLSVKFSSLGVVVIKAELSSRQLWFCIDQKQPCHLLHPSMPNSRGSQCIEVNIFVQRL